MKSRNLVVVLVMWALGAVAAAQSAPGQGSSGQAGSTHAPMQAHHAEPGQMPSMCKEMMQQHVEEMKSTNQTLNSNLAQMKATLPMISDINERNRWQTNIAMWQAVADHFRSMAEHMEHMQAMGMGCGMMGGTEHHRPATPAESKPK